jgi:hypothetical protein
MCGNCLRLFHRKITEESDTGIETTAAVTGPERRAIVPASINCGFETLFEGERGAFQTKNTEEGDLLIDMMSMIQCQFAILAPKRRVEANDSLYVQPSRVRRKDLVHPYGYKKIIFNHKLFRTIAARSHQS